MHNIKDQIKPIVKSLNFIEENLYNDITLTNIIDSAGYETFGCFDDNFRFATETTPYKYFQKRRFHKALYLLKNSEMKMEQIAKICGYIDRQSFTLSFKNHYSISPGKFRDYCNIESKFFNNENPKLYEVLKFEPLSYETLLKNLKKNRAPRGRIRT